MATRNLAVCLTCALICVSHHAFAEEGAPVPTNPGVSPPVPTTKAPSFDAEYSPKDWGNSILSGIAGGATVAGLGFLILTTTDIFTLVKSTYPVITVGGIFGSAIGVYYSGENSGHSGNFWAALGGSTTGMVGALSLYVLLDGSNKEAAMIIGITSGIILPSVFSTWFYSMTLESGEQHIPTGGLIDVDDGVVRLGVPELGVAFGAEGVERVDVKVLGARF